MDQPLTSVATEAPKVFTLRQVAQSIRRALDQATENRIWLVRAEIVKVRGQLGRDHVYLDLIDEAAGVKQAAMRGMIWQASGRAIQQELGAEAEQLLRAGTEIVFHARVSFHEVHGLALQIERIDLQFMLGELERRMRATMEMLEKQGATQWNKRIPMPLLPQRIALIGSPNTSGFRDFCTVLLGHPARFRYDLKVFAATVQGEAAPASLLAAIAQAEAWDPDLLVVVRGGGAKLDLDAFNHLEVCLKLARCLCPVWTGIGHESDFVLADAVAHTACKTPTETAQRILRISEELWAQLWHAGQRLSEHARNATRSQEAQLRHYVRQLEQSVAHRLDAAALRLDNASRSMREWSLSRCQYASEQLDALSKRLQELSRHAMENERRRLVELERTVHALDPAHTLARGFSIAWQSNRPVTEAARLDPGLPVQVQLHVGWLEAQVTQVHPEPFPVPGSKGHTPAPEEIPTDSKDIPS